MEKTEPPLQRMVHVSHKQIRRTFSVNVTARFLEEIFGASAVIGLESSDGNILDLSSPRDCLERLAFSNQETILVFAMAPKPEITYNPDDTFRRISNPYSTGQYAIIGSQHNQSQLNCAGQWVPSGTTSKPWPAEWLQIDCGRTVCVIGIITQGRGDGAGSMHVRSYTVAVSDDGINFRPVDGETEFWGNQDPTTLVTVRFQRRINARYVRIYPKTWVTYVCLRAGVLIQDL